MDYFKHIDLEDIIKNITDTAENEFNIVLCCDMEIVKEVLLNASETLSDFEIEDPNLAKKASAFAFWFRKLKPIHHNELSKNRYNAINEYISLKIGLSICSMYIDDTTKDCDDFKVPDRIFKDWISSFRKNSHSPHSSTIAFELFVSEQ